MKKIISYYEQIPSRPRKTQAINDHSNYLSIDSLVFQSLEITISNNEEEEEEDTQEINEEDAGILQIQVEQHQLMQYLHYQCTCIPQIG
ncbi:hypothetical protein BDC45DRAFT_573860 [Circinella umbellata]|nr:hypothetical protein BDC45DRAFT_573860 [Circinella umbellata]